MQEPLFQALEGPATAVLAFDGRSRLIWVNSVARILLEPFSPVPGETTAEQILLSALRIGASLEELEQAEITGPDPEASWPGRFARVFTKSLPLSDGSTARLVYLEPGIRASQSRPEPAAASDEAQADIFRTVLEHTVNLVLVVDERQTITLIAPSVEELLGYTPEECLGKPFSDLVQPSDHPLWAEILSQGPIRQVRDLRMRHKSGESRVFEMRSVDLRRRPTIDGYVVLARDISQRLQAEEAVRESELRYRRLFDQSRDIVSITDEDGRLIDVNRAGLELLGYDHKDEILKMDIGRSVWGDPEARAEVFRQARARGYTEFETRFSTRDDEARWVSGTMVEMRDDHGKPEGYLAIVRDVTDQKQVEDQLRQSQKMEAIGRLAGGIAHDFNNLLTAIGGYCDLLLDEAPNEETRSYVREIEAAGERASALTAKLLTLSRREPVTPKVIDLNDLIRDLHGLLRRLIGEDVQLRAEFSETPAWVKVDPGQMDQVILNLATNARDAMPQGGELTLRTELMETADSNRVSQQVCLSVVDTGVGMDAKTLQHIYEPFFTTKEAGKGTGLGLATVYATVHRFGGMIEATSRQGEGTAFQIFLPSLKAQPAAEGGADRVATEPAQGHETILLVEDDDTVRRLVTTQLKRQGYNVLTAEDGENALGQVSRAGNELKLDLVVSDVVMPGMSGPELAVHLREKLPTLPILFISGYTGAFMVQHGFCEGKDQLLNKPFTAKMLAERVRSLLDAPPEA